MLREFTMVMECSTGLDTFLVIVEQLTQSLQGQGVSISDVDFIILLAQDFQIPKYYNEIFTELFLKKLIRYVSIFLG